MRLAQGLVDPCCTRLPCIFAVFISFGIVGLAQNSAINSIADVLPQKTGAFVAQPIIRDGKMSLRLSKGSMHLYGMAIGSPGPATLFAKGQFASVFTEAGLLGAAIAYGKITENGFTTKTNRYTIGGISVAGSWDTFNAFYGSNATPGASSAAANFLVSETSLVVILALASSQQNIAIAGISGLHIDATNSSRADHGVIFVAHTYLAPGTYNVVEHSAGSGTKHDDYRSDLIGIFVFGSKP